jgi:hypothetical protein
MPFLGPEVMMSKPVLIILSVFMVLLVGLVKRDGTPIKVDDSMNVFGMDVRVIVKVEVNPERQWRSREPGIACVVPPFLSELPHVGGNGGAR